MARLPLALLALLALACAASGKFCFRCPFRFCYGHQELIMGEPDRALRGPICLNDGTKIGIFNTGQPYVYSQSRFGYDPISTSSPPGLKHRFSRSLFKGYPVKHYFKHLGKSVWVSGVGHEHFQMNQKEILKGKCVILPVTNYQILDDKWNLVKNVNGAGPWHDSCVSFYVY